MLFIRQGATHKIVLGPAVAVGDGFTPVTTLALTTADEAEAILHDNGTVVDISAYTWAAITTSDGYYHLTLQSGISGTVGHLTIVVQDDSLCLPLRQDFTVLEEAIYDALFAASANAWSGAAGSSVGRANDSAGAALATAAALDTVDNFIDTEIADIQNRLPAALVGGRIDATVDGTGLEAAAAAVIADAVWDEALSGHTTSGTAGERLESTFDYAVAIQFATVLATGSVNDASATATEFDTTLTQANDWFVDALIVFTTGNLAGQAPKPIAAFANVGGHVTVSETFTAAPDNGSAFQILVSHVHTVTAIADGILDRDASTHTTNSTLGAIINDWEDGGRLDLLLDDVPTTAEFEARTLVAANYATAAALDAVDNYIDTEIAAIVSAIGTPANLGGGATLAANLSDIEAQTDDIGAAGAGLTAIMTTALTESYRGTGATGTPAQLLYEILAHLGEFANTGTTKQLKKLDGVTNAKSFTYDDATTPTSITETT